MPPTIASIVAGASAATRPAACIASTNPAPLDDVVADASLGDAQTFADACRAARGRPARVGRGPRPPCAAARSSRSGGSSRTNKEALARARDPRDRQALRGVARRGPGDRRHVQLLPRRGPPALRPDRAERDARQAALHLPHAGRRRGDHHRRQLPGRRAALVPRARRCCAATPSCGSRPSTRRPAADALAQLFLHGGLPGRRAQPRARRRRADVRRAERALDGGLVDKVGFTGSSAVGRRIGELCGRHLQSPCLELGGKNPLVVMEDADLDLAVEGALFSGFGTAGQRCTSLGTVIVARRGPRRVRAAPGDCGRRARADRRPDPGRALRPDDPRAVRRAFEDHGSAWSRDHHARARLDRDRADHGRRTRAHGFVGDDPEAGLFYHPTLVDRRDGSTTSSPTRRPSARSSASPASATSTRRSRWPTRHGYGLSSAIYTNDPGPRVPLPRAGLRRDGVGQQLDERAPRRTFRSAATAARATARASRASGCSTSSRAGSR